MTRSSETAQYPSLRSWPYLRWGEIAELRPRDIDLRTRILTVSRTAVELNAKYHPDGDRFLVKAYPKDREWRRFKLDRKS